MNSNGHPEWSLMESSIDKSCSVSKPIHQEEMYRTSDRLVSATAGGAGGCLPDREAMLAQVEGDIDLFGELVELFIGSYPSQLEEIREGMNCHDPSRVREAAHSLKGSVANFQATTAVELAAALEAMGRDGDLALAPQKLIELEAQLSLIKTALTALKIEVPA